ncbi:MAG: hypothetical protein L3J39_09615 [Verrucomicrobiales bacterium]|nr:hypothetical protein [Verrucomicrobiales bacterium]
MKKIKILCITVLILVLAVGGAVTVVIHDMVNTPSHKHCIKIAANFLSSYASDNDGKYPVSKRGWGDALLKLNEIFPDAEWVPFFTGVGDYGSIYRDAIKDGHNIDESKCSRVYVQGLSRDSNRHIAILFDRDSVPGGDHLRSNLFGDPLREVILVGGDMKIIKDPQWEKFVQSQRQLLSDEGFCEEVIREVYGDPEQ